MKNRVTALIVISALLLSSISLALSLTSRFMPEAQNHGTVQPQAWTGLGGKTGVGFGDWTLTSAEPSLIIFSYPAGATSAGWDGYLVDMLITITVSLDRIGYGTVVAVTFRYLTGSTTITLSSTNLAPLGAMEQSTTFTEQIYEVELTCVAETAYGHYFVSADRRV